MADQDKTKKWTEEEKCKFLVQAVKQMQSAGGKLAWSKFDLTDRTPKSLMHLWAKLAKDPAYSNQDSDAGASDGTGSVPATPAAKRGGGTPGSRKRTAQNAAVGDGEGANGVPGTPTKRVRKTPVSRAKQIKSPAVVHDDDDEDELAKAEVKAEAETKMAPPPQPQFQNGNSLYPGEV
ncbi:hypothetical protein F4808DRAFT_471758 [Astrocystis sublimbata]|nr:hypothetical protein F4808DRAFT_471758 [Astrocystis sublimbata]